MAFKTSAEVIAEFTNHFPDCDSTTAGTYFLDAVQETARDMGLYAGSASLRLTSGSAAYSLVTSAAAPWYVFADTTVKATANITVFKEVFYCTDADTRQILKPVTTKQLTSDIDSHWRYRDAGTPLYWYMEATEGGANQLGLYPKPDTSSSPANGTGYPRVDVYYRWIPATASEVPDTLRNDQAVLYHMLTRMAIREGDSRRGEFEALYEDACGAALKTRHGFQRDNPPGFTIKHRFPKY